MSLRKVRAALESAGPPPAEIDALNEEIDGKTRALELRAQVLGLDSVTQAEVDEIVNLRRAKDGLYLDWLSPGGRR